MVILNIWSSLYNSAFAKRFSLDQEFKVLSHQLIWRGLLESPHDIIGLLRKFLSFFESWNFLPYFSFQMSNRFTIFYNHWAWMLIGISSEIMYSVSIMCKDRWR